MIYVVVLAAGASTRMEGKPKALAKDAGGVTFLTRIANTAREAGVAGVIAVVGHPHGDAIRKAMPAGVAAAINPKPDRGMLSSVWTGIDALPHGTQSMMVWPVDIPFVKHDTVRALMTAPGSKIVVPHHNGKGGHPVRIPKEFFGEILNLDPDKGLHALMDAKQSQVMKLDVDDPGITTDIDTPADLAKATKQK